MEHMKEEESGYTYMPYILPGATLIEDKELSSKYATKVVDDKFYGLFKRLDDNDNNN